MGWKSVNKAHWAIMLNVFCVVILTAGGILWDASSSRPIFSFQWRDTHYLSATASLAMSLAGRGANGTGHVEAWPVCEDRTGLVHSLLQGERWVWQSVLIPEGAVGGHRPRLRDYPPLTFAVGALWYKAFGPQPEGAQTASNILLMLFVSAMAYHGWQLAGFRGAVLLSLAASASPWTFQWSRYYNYVPGALLMLATSMILGHSSEQLKRPAACVWMGVTLGIGLLFSQLTLFVAIPWLLALVTPEGFKTRGSFFMMWVTLLGLQAVHGLIMWHARSAGDPAAGPSSAAIPAIFLLLAGLLALAAWGIRWKSWASGSGLAMTTAVAGLISSPYYLLNLGLQEDLVRGHIVSVKHGVSSVLAATWTFVRILHTFHWLGWLWLIAGSVLLLNWRHLRAHGARLALSIAAVILLMALMNPTILKYFGVVLPLALVLGFIWAARWRATFHAVTTLLAAMMLTQALGWLYLGESRPNCAPGPARSLSLLLEDPKMNRALWTSFPLADLPGGEALLPDSVPLGARVCLLYGHNPQVVRAPITSSWRPHEEFLCNLALHLHLRGRIVAPEDLKPGDYILLCHHPCEGPMPRFRDGGAPLFSGPEHLSLSDAWTGFRMRAQLRRCQQSLPERISRSRHKTHELGH